MPQPSRLMPCLALPPPVLATRRGLPGQLPWATGCQNPGGSAPDPMGQMPRLSFLLTWAMHSVAADPDAMLVASCQVFVFYSAPSSWLHRQQAPCPSITCCGALSNRSCSTHLAPWELMVLVLSFSPGCKVAQE